MNQTEGGHAVMHFYPETAEIPESLLADEVLVRPLRATDAQADFEALMSSQEMLRKWDQSDWPSDDFTLEENRADLAEHETEHAARQAFTFTVMDRSEQTCLGCVYVYSLETILRSMGASEEQLAAVGDFEAYVTFWIRESELSENLDKRFLLQLVEWLDTQWAFQRITLGTNTADAHQSTLFRELEFAEQWRFPIAGSESEYLICARG
jgi:hypothetical protein